MSEHVRTSIEAGVLRVMLNRPDKKNALTDAMYGMLGDILEHADKDDSVRVVLLQAAGDAFCAGNDLADFAAVAQGTLSREKLQIPRFLEALARARKPYVAAVHGLAIGIGVTMLLHCDLVYVADSAQLSTPFVNLALVPEAASTLLMPARIGHARAFEMFALGKPISGPRAVELGLANAAVPADQLQTHAWEAARLLAAKPPGSLQATKQLMRDADTLAALAKKESAVFTQRLTSPEAAEALRAFAERRPADFSKF